MKGTEMNRSTPGRVTVTESDVSGPYAQIVTAGRHVLSADEAESVGGHDTGPSPYEYLMAGLGTCATMTMRMYAQRHQWTLRRSTVEVWHEKVASTDGRSTTDCFRRLIHLDADLTDEQRRRLSEIAEKCPVTRALRQSSLVESELAGALVNLQQAPGRECEVETAVIPRATTSALASAESHTRVQYQNFSPATL
jgi:putative redox protein